MSNLEVALRLRLDNQLSKGAEDVKRDLAEIERAAVQLGRSRGGEELANSLDKVGREAREARGDVQSVEDAADKTREALRRIDQATLDRMRREASEAGRAVLDIGEDADRVRQALGRLGSANALDALKTSADQAEDAVRRIGTAADESATRLRRLRDAGPGAGRATGIGAVGPVRSGPGYAQGAFDRSGLDAYLPLGVGGAAYAAGGATAVGVTAGAAAYKSYAWLSREMGWLGNTAGVSKEQVEAGVDRLRDAANDAHLTFDKAFEGFKALNEAGILWADALAMMPAIGQTSTASGADPAAVAKTYHAVMTSLKMRVSDLPKASDIMIEGGNWGQFEFRDMASYLPGLLAASASRKGFNGESGLASIVSAAQVIRARTGSAGQAATQLENVLLKMDSPETQKNFGEAGVDLSGGLRAAVSAGKDPIDTLIELTDQALAKGAQLNELFRDTELYLGVNALMQGRDDKAQLQADLLSSDGSTERNFNRIAGDAQSAIDRLSNSFKGLTHSAGELLHTIGVTDGLNYLSRRLQNLGKDPLGTISPVLGAVRDTITAPQSQGDLYRQYGRTRSIANAGSTEDKLRAAIGPTMLERQEAEAAAADAMGGYNSQLQAEGEASKGIVQGFVDQIRSMLNFTAGPTIRPTLAPAAPAGEAVSGPRSSLEGGSKPVSVTQNIYSPSSKVAARAAQREQNRAVRMAQANALSDMGLA